MAANENAWGSPIVEVCEGLHDDFARIGFIVTLDFFLGHLAGARDIAMECIRMRRAITDNGFFRLGEGHRVSAMGMDDRANRREGAIEFKVGG